MLLLTTQILLPLINNQLPGIVTISIKLSSQMGGLGGSVNSTRICIRTSLAV